MTTPSDLRRLRRTSSLYARPPAPTKVALLDGLPDVGVTLSLCQPACHQLLDAKGGWVQPVGLQRRLHTSTFPSEAVAVAWSILHRCPPARNVAERSATPRSATPRSARRLSREPRELEELPTLAKT